MRLQQKILVLFVSIAFLIGGPLLWTVRRASRSVDLEEVAQRGELAAATVAEQVTAGFQAAQERLLLPILQVAQEQTGALYAAAINPEGRVLGHTNVAENGVLLEDARSQGDSRNKQPQSELKSYQGVQVMEVTVPVFAQGDKPSAEDFLLSGKPVSPETYLGMIRLALPLDRVRARERKLLNRIALIVVIAGGTGILLLFAFMRRVLRPIEWLSAGTARIAKGDYGTQVPVTSNDELGALAVDFNEMSKALSETTVSKDFLGSILLNMADPLIVMTMEAKIRMVNQAALDLLGYSRKELEGQPVHILFVPRDAAFKEAAHETLVLKESVRNLELEVIKKTGQKVPVLFSSSVMKNGDLPPSGIIAVAKDMTERKRLEGMIRQSDKLSAVGQLAAGVAHEINNPLGVILGFSQASLRRLTPGNPLEMPLRSIEKEAVRCKNLVQDLLTFSRVSKVEREPIDLNQTIEGALSLVTAQAKVARIELKKILASGLPRMMGNPNQIQQVIVNLATNAFDAMGDHGTFTVKTEILQEDPLSWIRLRVSDTGPGIPDEILHRIFEPFFTTKPVGKGTGLGLSLIHEIIKKHSGTIDVKSHPGMTEFEIKFPVRLAPSVLTSAKPR